MSKPAYTFTQSLQEITVYVPLEPGTRAKSLDINIERKHISAKSKAGINLVVGELFALVLTEDCTWAVEDEKELIISLEKYVHQWWPHVLTTDEKIDVTKLVPENSSLSSLDPETQQTVEKMMFDQRQKQQGLPTSDEMQRDQMLENFKKMHPELDFSQLQSSNIKFSD